MPASLNMKIMDFKEFGSIYYPWGAFFDFCDLEKMPWLMTSKLKKFLLFTVFHFFEIFLITLENLQCSARFKLFEIRDFGVRNPKIFKNPWSWLKKFSATSTSISAAPRFYLTIWKDASNWHNLEGKSVGWTFFCTWKKFKFCTKLSNTDAGRMRKRHVLEMSLCSVPWRERRKFHVFPKKSRHF